MKVSPGTARWTRQRSGEVGTGWNEGDGNERDREAKSRGSFIKSFIEMVEVIVR